MWPTVLLATDSGFIRQPAGAGNSGALSSTWNRTDAGWLFNVTTTAQWGAVALSANDSAMTALDIMTVQRRANGSVTLQHMWSEGEGPPTPAQGSASAFADVQCGADGNTSWCSFVRGFEPPDGAGGRFLPTANHSYYLAFATGNVSGGTIGFHGPCPTCAAYARAGAMWPNVEQNGGPAPAPAPPPPSPGGDIFDIATVCGTPADSAQAATIVEGALTACWVRALRGAAGRGAARS